MAIRQMQKVEIHYQGKNRFMGLFITREEAMLVNNIARRVLNPTKDLEISAEEAESIAKRATETSLEALRQCKASSSAPVDVDSIAHSIAQRQVIASANEDPAATAKVEEVQVQILLRAAEEAEAVQEKEDEAKQITPTQSNLGAAEVAVAARMNRGDEDAFPILLHSIVSDKSTDNCIVWLPCGTKFIVTDKDAFARDVMPRFVPAKGSFVSAKGSLIMPTKYTSFTRRLKRWNFTRVPSGRTMGAYYHENFKRDEPELAKSVVYPDYKNQKKVERAARTTPKCSNEDCTNKVVKWGVCWRHGAKDMKKNSNEKVAEFDSKTCSHDGCTNLTEQDALCFRHGAKNATCSHDGYRFAEQRNICIHKGCPNHAQRGGVCIRHGANQIEGYPSHFSTNNTIESLTLRVKELEGQLKLAQENNRSRRKREGEMSKRPPAKDRVQSQIQELEDEMTRREAREELIRELENELMERSARTRKATSTSALGDVIFQNTETALVDAPLFNHPFIMENGRVRGYVQAFERAAVPSRNAEVPCKRPISSVCGGASPESSECLSKKMKDFISEEARLCSQSSRESSEGKQKTISAPTYSLLSPYVQMPSQQKTEPESQKKEAQAEVDDSVIRWNVVSVPVAKCQVPGCKSVGRINYAGTGRHPYCKRHGGSQRNGAN